MILLTGFEPFDGDAHNVSWEAVRAVKGVAARRLSCDAEAAVVALRAVIAELAPSAIIAVGQASRRTAINVERMAAERDDFRYATLPVERIADAINAGGVNAVVSNDAGDYVCNHLFYELMRVATVPAGFIHVPTTMPLADIVRALRIAVRVSLLAD
jgi:pyroglutamyl-peptidase